jgi:methylglutaconyl-CoA hydratase
MTQVALQGALTTTIENKIATVQFNPASNSPRHLLNKLTNELDTLSNNNEVSIVILKK